jgi:predicted small lipoprotein YifL
MFPIPRITAVLLILSLAACGYKGPLELPPSSSQTSAGDVSTAQRTSPAR